GVLQLASSATAPGAAYPSGASVAIMAPLILALPFSVQSARAPGWPSDSRTPKGNGMIIRPKIRGFICTNAHPEGCAAHVAEQIAYVKSQPAITNGPKKVLVIGASTGFGLASRITAAFGCGADTLGIFFEKPPTESKTASAGYYNSAAFEKAAREAGLYTHSINGDAFSDACKQETIERIKADMGQVDLVIYSLAAPRRTDPKTGQ